MAIIELPRVIFSFSLKVSPCNFILSCIFLYFIAISVYDIGISEAGVNLVFCVGYTECFFIRFKRLPYKKYRVNGIKSENLPRFEKSVC